MAVPTTLRIILPIGKRAAVTSRLTNKYPGWKLLVRRILRQSTMEMMIRLPDTLAWSQQDEDAWSALCQGVDKCVFFWDPVYGEVTAPPEEVLIAELLRALGALVAEPEALRSASQYHEREGHAPEECPVCRAWALYECFWHDK